MIRISDAPKSSQRDAQYMPTRVMIRKMTAEIRRGWSEHTRLKREGRVEQLVALIELASIPNRCSYSIDD